MSTDTLVSQSNNSGDSLIISYLALRKSVGILGIALPFVSVLGSFVFSDCRTILPSISQYYYSVMGNFFVGSLCSVAIFLFSYKGYDKWDKISTNAAAVFAVGSAFFPTHLNKLYMSCAVNIVDCTDLTNTIHNITAALFFVTLALISILLFTQSKGVMTDAKKMRNKIYRICGYTMLASITLIGIYQIPAVFAIFRPYKLTVFLETLALLSFGFSWLTKGEFLLKDNQEATVS